VVARADLQHRSVGSRARVTQRGFDNPTVVEELRVTTAEFSEDMHEARERNCASAAVIHRSRSIELSERHLADTLR